MKERDCELGMTLIITEDMFHNARCKHTAGDLVYVYTINPDDSDFLVGLRNIENGKVVPFNYGVNDCFWSDAIDFENLEPISKELYTSYDPIEHFMNLIKD